MKRILYFMPDNPMSGKAGNITRLQQMLSYFNDNEVFEVDFVSLRDWGMWKENDEEEFKKRYTNVKLYLLEKKYKKNFFKYLFLYKIPYLFKSNPIDISSYILKKEFRKIAKSGGYDKIVVSYASWGSMIKDSEIKSYKIIDTHDFITAQNRERQDKIGTFFKGEMDILRYFDEIWTYSIEEEYIFSQFTHRKVTLMPISFPSHDNSNNESYPYEIIYVASDNPHNILGINWFINEVLPRLENHKVHVIGKIGNVLPDHPNIIKHGLVDSLDDYYKSAKIAICPMLSGTGIKIKVLEALSYSLPVVTNRRGVDGLINKSLNGCLVSESGLEFADNIMKLLNDDKFYEEIKHYGKKYFLENHMINQEKKILDHTFLND
ncbi:glycosyltransferase [Elizabethkingia meningoseptica]|uniref:glycosyltransferase n=2 Tax=Elizabethkingia meningoseptica TaxID=238 RepID=UPI0021A751DB|nr:glycosyltransferase family 4 protein [Elizabethkingia meningoseptica]MCL1687632.1 glycosyltransferase family 4 protein [Elizabethkingia meningoseptica]MEC4712586.1 glycosyltransferase family 4 protein [Elizabethkingia meningoseptica]